MLRLQQSEPGRQTPLHSIAYFFYKGKRDRTCQRPSQPDEAERALPVFHHYNFLHVYLVLHHVVVVVVRVLFVEVCLPLDGHLGFFFHLGAHLKRRKVALRKRKTENKGENHPRHRNVPYAERRGRQPLIRLEHHPQNGARSYVSARRRCEMGRLYLCRQSGPSMKRECLSTLPSTVPVSLVRPRRHKSVVAPMLLNSPEAHSFHLTCSSIWMNWSSVTLPPRAPDLAACISISSTRLAFSGFTIAARETKNNSSHFGRESQGHDMQRA